MKKKITNELYDIVIAEDDAFGIVISVNNLEYAHILDLNLDETNTKIVNEFVEKNFDLWDNKFPIILQKFDFMVDGTTCSDKG